MINDTITITSNFTANLTEQFMSWANLSNFNSTLINLASEAPKYSSGIDTGAYVMSIIGGLSLIIFGYVIKDEHKHKNKGICQKCGQELKLIKCADKKCGIRICEPCNLKDKNPILNMCMICSKYVCKEHYGVTHIHKKLSLYFNAAKTMIKPTEVIEIEPELLPVEYYGNNKELAYIAEPKGFRAEDKEDRESLMNTLLKLREEGYSYKGYGYEFYLLEKQGNILPPSLINNEIGISKIDESKEPEKFGELETYDFEEMDAPAQIEWSK